MAEAINHMFDDGSGNQEKKKLRSVWCLVRRFDVTAGSKQLVLLKEIPDGAPSKVVKQAIVKELQINTPDVVLKLRNQRGVLIVANGSIPTNTKSKIERVTASMYLGRLSVLHSCFVKTFLISSVDDKMNVKPKEKTVELPEYNEILQATIEDFVSRIDRMERELPDLEKRKEQKFERDVQELEKKLVFIQQRFDEADRTRWEGNMRKNPLW